MEADSLSLHKAYTFYAKLDKIGSIIKQNLL